jgi:SAM-dependent methyltransferase
VSSTTVQPEPIVLQIMSAYALATSIFSAFEIGLWDALDKIDGGSLDVDSFISANNLNPRATWGLVDHLVRRRALQKSIDGRIFLDDLGKQLVEQKWLPYIVYFVGGYGRVLSAGPDLAKNRLEYGVDITRSDYYVAVGTRLMSGTKHHRSYEAVLSRASQAPAEQVLDLGCGDGSFLCDLVSRTRSSIGIGIDVSEEACRLATENVWRRGLQDRIHIVHSDIRDVCSAQPSLLQSCDVVTSMMVLHEFLADGSESVKELFSLLRDLLRPRSGRFLMLDKQTDLLDKGYAPVYLTEYKLVHDLTLQDLCSSGTWINLLNAAGFRVDYSEVLPPHTGSILFECTAAIENAHELPGYFSPTKSAHP